MQHLNQLSRQEMTIVGRLVHALDPAPIVQPVIVDIVSEVAAKLDDTELLERLAQAAETGQAHRARNHALLNERFGAVSRG